MPESQKPRRRQPGNRQKRAQDRRINETFRNQGRNSPFSDPSSLPDHPKSPSSGPDLTESNGARAANTPKAKHGSFHLGNKKGLLVAAGVAGAAGGGGLIYSRMKTKGRPAVARKFYNPFEDDVTKAAPANPASGTNVRSVRPIVPGGGHVSHENQLSVTRHRSTQPSNAKLALYRRGSKRTMTGGGQSFGKSLSTQQGAAVLGTRGTPMADLGRQSRVGHRLALD